MCTLSLSLSPLHRSASPSLQLRGNFFLYCADCGPVLPGIRGYSRISARAFSLFNTSPHSSSFQQMARDRGETRNRSCAETWASLPFSPAPSILRSFPLFSPSLLAREGVEDSIHGFIRGNNRKHDSFGPRTSRSVSNARLPSDRGKSFPPVESRV